MFSLLAWADKQGRTPELVQGALHQAPGNEALQSVAILWTQVDAGEGTPPYQGLAYFDEADAARFFGREALAAQLVTYLQERRFLVVVGASGSGKSSLVRARCRAPAAQRSVDRRQRLLACDHCDADISAA